MSGQLFDIILSGSFDEVDKFENELLEYLPRLTFYASFCWPNLFKSLYSYPEVNRIQDCFNVDAKKMIQTLKQSIKENPIDKLLFSQNDQDNMMNLQTIDVFEKSDTVEQLNMVATELYQLSNIFHYDIPDDKINIDISQKVHIPLDDVPSNKKKRDKNQEKLEERRRKKQEKNARQSKLLLKQQAASKLPILSSSTYLSLLRTLIPCIPFIITHQQDGDPTALTINVNLPFYYNF